MTIDHIGYFVFPEVLWLRIIGRLAFPIFAFMIAQGCFYTRNIWRYFGTMFACAAIMQLVYAICMHSLYQSIMTTFTLSILSVICLQNLEKKRDVLSAVLFVLMIAADVFICKILPNTLPTFQIDYGLFGVLLPLIAYLPLAFANKIDGSNANDSSAYVAPTSSTNATYNITEAYAPVSSTNNSNTYIAPTSSTNTANAEPKRKKSISPKLRYFMIGAFAIGLVLLCFDIVRPSWNIQWWSLLSLVLLVFYNGKRGSWHMKYLFYIYYPCHILVLYLIGQMAAGAF